MMDHTAGRHWECYRVNGTRQTWLFLITMTTTTTAAVIATSTSTVHTTAFFPQIQHKTKEKLIIQITATSVIAKQRLFDVVHFLKFLAKGIPVLSICLLQMCNNELTLKSINQ